MADHKTDAFVPDKELTFQRVSRAYEEAEHKRERYKKIGPAFVFISGIIFLTLMFTLDNKITFLILWVITVLYIAALMIRVEYKCHQFKYYLGIVENESETEEESDSEEETTEEKQQEEHI